MKIFEGAVTLAASYPRIDIAQFRQNVTSLGGKTAETIASFEADYVGKGIFKGIEACRVRSVELGKQFYN